MIEIIAAVWLSAFLLSLPITFLNVRSAVKKAQSPQTRMLNANLKKIGMFWSLSSETFTSLDEANPKSDLQKVIRSYLMIGALGLFSVLGLLLLFAVSISMQKLVKSRTTEKVYASDLVKQPDLDSSKIQALVDSVLNN